MVKHTFHQSQMKKNYKIRVVRREGGVSVQGPDRKIQTVQSHEEQRKVGLQSSYPHQGQGHSGNTQHGQNRQDDPVVVVDCKCTKSKYTCKNMNDCSWYFQDTYRWCQYQKVRRRQFEGYWLSCNCMTVSKIQCYRRWTDIYLIVWGTIQWKDRKSIPVHCRFEWSIECSSRKNMQLDRNDWVSRTASQPWSVSSIFRIFRRVRPESNRRLRVLIKNQSCCRTTLSNKTCWSRQISHMPQPCYILAMDHT